jgi:hypothetical protein
MGIEQDVRRAFALHFPEYVTGDAVASAFGDVAAGTAGTTLGILGGLIYPSSVDEGGDVVPIVPSNTTRSNSGAGCKYIRDVSYGDSCKTCIYSCPGYNAPVTFGQAVGLTCPEITSQGLVDTSRLDPKCSGKSASYR